MRPVRDVVAAILLATVPLGGCAKPPPPRVCEPPRPEKHGTELGMCPIDLPGPAPAPEPPDAAAPSPERIETGLQSQAPDAGEAG